MTWDTDHPINRPVTLVTGGTWQQLTTDQITARTVGLKAEGLLRLPPAWVPQFFVVSGDTRATQEAIDDAAAACKMDAAAAVYVRSSGTREGIEERGALDSDSCRIDEVARTIDRLAGSIPSNCGDERQLVHFIVQIRIPSRKQGHLSNERRLSRYPRDWHVEIERDGLYPVGVRRWRNAAVATEQRLGCSNRHSIPRALRALAAWVGGARAHLEWIWDGSNIWIVQLDLLPDARDGVDPRLLVQSAKKAEIIESNLNCFVVANDDHYRKYAKLNNARIYSGLGYTMPPFYILDGPEILASILDRGEIPDKLKSDLDLLCSAPFVLRSDAIGLDETERQMLPRSDELRSRDAAISWLLGPFRRAIKASRSDSQIALIGHHFIPAAASGWAQAAPNERRVRIEALWGIPEGTYYFAHDVYDVDTAVADVGRGCKEKCRKISDRERYKARFIAPNEKGEWIVHRTDARSDWVGSVAKHSWLQEIAWTTRRIAAKVQKPVVVMWFIDVAQGCSNHGVLPWYHHSYEPAPGGYRKAAPRKKFSRSLVREITGRASWEKLKRDVDEGNRVERLFINPDESEIIRNKDFVEELANHAIEHDYVVELSGGLLSHAFYQLTKAGCNVECVDLFGVEDEQFEFNKIVRDLIPKNISDKGESAEVVKLRGNALVEALKRKLVEEAYEVFDARSTDSIIEELADVLEALSALQAALGVDAKEVERVQAEKRKGKGGFSEGLMLVKTSLSTPVSPGLERETSVPPREISREEDLPPEEQDFHLDKRIDAGGLPERQMMLTLSACANNVAAGNHRFDLETQTGEPHEMFANVQVERHRSVLKLRMRITNAAVQLSLPLDRKFTD